MDNALEVLCGPQIEVESVSDLRLKIHMARSVKEMNALRTAVVDAKDADVLREWQQKYWNYKKSGQ